MAQKTPIPWTDWTWSPVIGCTRVSPGCEHCYAERLVAVRMSRNPMLPMYHGLASVRASGEPQWSGEVRFLPERLAEPLSWRKPRKVFVCDMSDMFHDGVTNEQIAAVFGVMAATPHITYQILTKRPERMARFFAWLDKEAQGPSGQPRALRCGAAAANFGADVDYLGLPDVWPLPNLWVGTTVEDQKRADDRLQHLRRVPARVRFLSIEPLLERIEPQLDGISWVIIGGESGQHARPFDVAWARDLLQRCREAGTAPFVKQLGSHVIWDGISRPGEYWPSDTRTEDRMIGQGWRVHLRDRAGGNMSEWPDDLKVRDFPEVTP